MGFNNDDKASIKIEAPKSVEEQEKEAAQGLNVEATAIK